MQRGLVVSIHDVAPSTREKTERILAHLARRRVEVCSLLVVPDYHRQGRSLADPDFGGWLQELEARGHEIVIHGFYHQRARRLGENARARFVTRIYTADEGEFFDLRYDEALPLIKEAQRDFEAHGFYPHGFIAPAWLLGAEAERAVIDAGFCYTTTLRTVRDFASRRTIASQSLVYSVRSGWRRTMSLAWNRSLFGRLKGNPLLRLGIHPPDLDHPAIREQITSLVDESMCDRRPMTYEGWLAAVAHAIT
ncbi:DUF2334 domain-containing protein [soil metagenome]